MRKLLLITTALVGFSAVPDRAEAEPVTLAIATAFSVQAGTAAFALIQGVVSLAVSVGISMVGQALRKKPRGETVRAELALPTSLPAYRFVYGKTWAPGTPVAWKVRGRVLYVCYLLNSRPSAGPFTVYFDKRPVGKVGDEFDFAGTGAAVNSPGEIAGSKPPGHHAIYWIGRGDQTSCPARIVSETNGYFTATDAWRGRTVLWARLDCGDDDERQTRWPVTPPALNVDGNWSLVYDPRDGQEKFTRNQGLIVLDALRKNPLRPYRDRYLVMDTFSWGANVAGQAVGVKGGGTIARYLCDGILVFADGAELEDQLEPLLAAGASRLARIGGRLALVPGIGRASVKTIRDFTDGQPVDLVRWRSSDDLYTEAVARYLAPDRGYESAETPAHVVPGAQVEDGGTAKRLTVDLDFVTDYRQAERLAKIAVMRSRMQRQVSAELFPDCFDLVSGSVCDLDLPPPYTGWNRQFEVQSIAPAAGLNDDLSVTVRLPVSLIETSPDIWAWNPATEEQDVLIGSIDNRRGRVMPPPKPAITTGSAAATQSGDAVVPGVVGAWTASASASAASYYWQWQRRDDAGQGDTQGWRTGGDLDVTAADSAGVFVASIPWVDVGRFYRIRVQTVGTHGRSDWIVSDWIMAMGPAAQVATPPAPDAQAGTVGRINLTLRQANDRAARELLLYAASVNNPLAANQIGVPFEAGASVTITTAEAGLAMSQTRYYWTRARDQWGNLSEFSIGASATTT